VTKRYVTQIWLLSTKRTLTGTLNDYKRIRPKCKVEAIQTPLVIWGERIWEEAALNAGPKEMKDCA
jgi:hypothetical protein